MEELDSAADGDDDGALELLAALLFLRKKFYNRKLVPFMGYSY